ncbi:MAG TPA: response regulator [Acidimicrobiales bacterium]|nr:response regulator [Acidimicrobiales bacterium]
MSRKDKPYNGEDRRGPARVVVVNDDTDAGKLLQNVLEHEGYPVEGADTHEAALSAATKGLPRAMILDLTHGGIGSNLKLLESIRHHDDERVATTRILLIARQASNRMFSFQSGADGFLVRPFHANELLDQLGKVLATPFNELPQHRRQRLEND